MEQKFVRTVMEQNQTIAKQQQEIDDLKREASVNLTTQDQKYAAVIMDLNHTILYKCLQKILKQPQQHIAINITQHECSLMEQVAQREAKPYSLEDQGLMGKQNQSSYELVLHDAVDKLIANIATYNNQTQRLNKTVADLINQIRSLSLSMINNDNRLSLLNTSLTGKTFNICSQSRFFFYFYYFFPSLKKQRCNYI